MAGKTGPLTSDFAQFRLPTSDHWNRHSPPEKREVTGSTPVPTTEMSEVRGLTPQTFVRSHDFVPTPCPFEISAQPEPTSLRSRRDGGRRLAADGSVTVGHLPLPVLVSIGNPVVVPDD